MTNSKRYNPANIEEKWYSHWIEKGYFHSTPDDREPYTIVIPPPNVTGVLHMGHMLNNTIQDILIRKARLEGKNACWVPGTDHASIATEAKVVKLLREKGISKSDITRDEFMEYAFEWKEKYGGIILEQLKKLGASCDWERTRFTLEDSLSRVVVKSFVDLYEKGKLYRGLRMINWDPEAKTALSNEEVLYSEEQSKLYYVQYQIEGEDNFITIATTRPETILGDTAIAVHPNDPRYSELERKRAIVPVVKRSVPIIRDDYVDMEFGTGALKITPAHDPNDYEIGLRHDLEVIDTFNDDGTMSESAKFFIGEDRFDVRKKMVKKLEEEGHLVKIEDYKNKVGRSERTDAFVEPRLKEQWFLDMKGFAKSALEVVREGEVRFFPEHFFNMYYNWLNEDNVRDWCISRQLWWGQRIPAYYYKDRIFVSETPEGALKEARKETGDTSLTLNDLAQDEDVVDTWFSSQFWPISVFDGFDTQEELKYYYPTNVLVTAWDIMFFWVARMIMMGYEYAPQLLGEELSREKGVQPFNDVYFTGMVRDDKRRRMSKSLGNSPDALALIDNYGADGVRFGMLSSASAGNDIIFDAPFDREKGTMINESKLCEQGLRFCNKIFNAMNFFTSLEIVDDKISASNEIAIDWIENKLKATVKLLNKDFNQYRLSDALMKLHKLIWEDFCSWFIEMIKHPKGKIDRETRERAIVVFEKMMTLLHPFMPFITEEVWHSLKAREVGEDCVISRYPDEESYDESIILSVEEIQKLISRIRDTRKTNNIKSKELIPLLVEKTDHSEKLFDQDGIRNLLIKMGSLESFGFAEKEVEGSIELVSGKERYYLMIESNIDIASEVERIRGELEYQKGFIATVEKKLNNERFVNNAPDIVVDKEKQKLSDGKIRLQILEEGLKKLMNG